MAKTYAQLAREIEGLKAQADAALKREASGVIGRMKEAIDLYGLTAEDLGLSGTSGASTNLAKNQPSKAPAKKPAPQKSKLAVRYRDDAGNTWTGRGSKPRWLAAALAAGQPLEAFTVGKTDASQAVPGRGNASPGTASGKSKAKPKATVKYRDDAGHTWSGYGPKPGWLKSAIASGKALEELAA